MAHKTRLDVLLAERRLAPSREAARRLIMAGEVRVDGTICDKPGTLVPSGAALEVQHAPRFVSRGGEKLDSALAAFAIDVVGRVCADVGASTGGFTDCLLQRGAARVYAIDVGYGQINWRLRADPRVIVLERTNARYLQALPEPVNLIAADVSFISLRYLFPVLRGWLAPEGELVTLIKPQFEAGPEYVGKGGVVREPAVHQRVLNAVLSAARETGFLPRGLMPSPLRGPAGNIEFLAWLTTEPGGDLTNLDHAIAAAVASAHDAGDPAQPGDLQADGH